MTLPRSGHFVLGADGTRALVVPRLEVEHAEARSTIDGVEHWRHHTGYAIGLRYHEGPSLDSGDHTEIRPGMVFTVEPGLYSPELGGSGERSISIDSTTRIGPPVGTAVRYDDEQAAQGGTT